MRKYSEFRPTQFDSHIELEDREDWYVLGLIQTRDSGCLDISNFEAAQKLLGDDIPGNQEYCDLVEVHRFGHWGPGWFEIILVHPSMKEVGEEIEARLADYPVLDEEDFSAREHEEEMESWDSWGEKEILEALQEEFGLADSTVDWFTKKGCTYSLYCDHSSGTEHTDEGARFDTSWIRYNSYTPGISRDKLASWIKAWRKFEKKDISSSQVSVCAGENCILSPEPGDIFCSGCRSGWENQHGD